ncbi:MAG: DNA-processing protein DprA, partial [Gemmatimonadaceae bacterium]
MPETPRSPDVAGRRAALALSLAESVGPVRYRELVARFGSAERAWDAWPGGAGRARAWDESGRALDRAARLGAQLLLQSDEEYPTRLLELHDPPPALWTVGARALFAGPAVAIVGTRSATAYGERVTRQLARAIASNGIAILSGMARGIDAAAHHAALAVGGHTIGVLGTGVDVAYPAMHRALHAEIARSGLLVSEELPGAGALPGSFPKRNRIIAALATVTFVVEAPARSGALITASHALDLGRTVAAVPGPIDAPACAGTNELIRDGAVVIASIDDALALVGASASRVAAAVPSDPGERRIWDALAGGALDLDTLSAATNLSARECLGAV